MQMRSPRYWTTTKEGVRRRIEAMEDCVKYASVKENDGEKREAKNKMKEKRSVGWKRIAFDLLDPSIKEDKDVRLIMTSREKATGLVNVTRVRVGELASLVALKISADAEAKISADAIPKVAADADPE